MKVYIDTNVLAYAAGAGEIAIDIRRTSRKLLRLGRRRRIDAVASLLTVIEIERARSRSIRRKALSWLSTGRVRILPREWDGEAKRIAAVYRSRGVVPPAQAADAEHLAWATLAEADVLASWNRAHLVRLKTRHLVGIINPELGYRTVGVEVPTEVIREIETP